MEHKVALNCIVVDDEPLALALLSDYIRKIPDLNLIEATSNPLTALELVKKDDIDLIFLDMQMPELNGVQFMKILQRRCMVVIVTAYSEFALDGYNHHVIDYLLKPVTLDRFVIAIEKALERHRLSNLENLRSQPQSNPETPYIFVKTDYRIVKILLDDIYFLEGAGDYVVIHTNTDQVLTLQSLKALEDLLPSASFIRVHKSFIVSLSKINFIERNRISIKNQLIPVSDSYKSQLFDHIKA